MKLWERLRGKEFKYVLDHSRKYFGRFIVVFVSEGVHKKVGFIASKKVGKAVERNRAKRLMREAFLKFESSLPDDKSYVIIAKKGIAKAKVWDVLEDLKNILSRSVRK